MPTYLAQLAAQYPGTTSPCTYFDGIADAANTRTMALMSEACDITVSAAIGSVRALGLSGISLPFAEGYTPPILGTLRTLQTAGRYRAIRATVISTGLNTIAPSLEVADASGTQVLKSVITNGDFEGVCKSTYLVYALPGTAPDATLEIVAVHEGEVSGSPVVLTTRAFSTEPIQGDALTIWVGGESGFPFDFVIRHVSIELI